MDDSHYAKQKIENIPDILLDPIDNIVKNMGVTRSHFLRMQLRIIVDSYPDEMKSTDPNQNDKNMVNLTNLSPEIKRKIKVISGNIGISQSAFIKMELQKIVNTYPDDMKKPPLDY